MRSWYRAGIVSDLNPLFLSIVEEKRQLEGLKLSDDQFKARELSWIRDEVQELAAEER